MSANMYTQFCCIPQAVWPSISPTPSPKCPFHLWAYCRIVCLRCFRLCPPSPCRESSHQRRLIGKCRCRRVCTYTLPICWPTTTQKYSLFGIPSLLSLPLPTGNSSRWKGLGWSNLVWLGGPLECSLGFPPLFSSISLYSTEVLRLKFAHNWSRGPSTELLSFSIALIFLRSSISIFSWKLHQPKI